MELVKTTELKINTNDYLKTNSKVNSAMVIDLDYYNRIKTDFGHVFIDSALEVILTRIVESFEKCDASVCQTGGGMIFVLWRNTDGECALERAHTIQNIVANGYIGESNRKLLRPLCKVGIVSGSFESFDEYYDKAHRALLEIKDGHERVCVYKEEMNDKHMKHHEARNYLGDNHVPQDHEFISLVAKLLTHSRNNVSTVKLILEMAGKRFGLTDIIMYEYDDTMSLMHRVGLWTKKNGLEKTHNEINPDKEWDRFARCFDRNGYMEIVDGDNKNFTDDDRRYCADKNIKSSINCVLYNDNRMVGYLSFCDKEKARRWSRLEQATFYETANLISLFIAKNQNVAAKHAISHMTIDSLTGLMTMPQFINEAQQKYLKREEGDVCVLAYADINNFSYVNENFGFVKGDQVLAAFADKLKRPGVLGARITSDRFLTFSLYESAQSAVEYIKRANDKVNTRFRKHFPISDVRISTGICVMDTNVDDIRSAIEKANAVRKLVKQDRKVSYAIYTEEINEKKKKELAIIGSVHKAIENGEIEAYLQPKYSLSQNCIIGAEALVRWRKEDGSVISPAEFVPILENVGYIVDVDYCVYEQILKCCARWKDEGKQLIPISVNFSRKHTSNPKFVETMCALADKYGVDKKYIEVEITESTISDNNIMMRHMERLREAGFKLDMDDFGTGYSSLDLLMEAPVDVVKIDKRFIDKTDSESGRTYIKQIADLVVAAGKDIIFEGVETQTQADFLLKNGYSKIQGYYFDRPIPINEFEAKYIV